MDLKYLKKFIMGYKEEVFKNNIETLPSESLVELKELVDKKYLVISIGKNYDKILYIMKNTKS